MGNYCIHKVFKVVSVLTTDSIKLLGGFEAPGYSKIAKSCKADELIRKGTLISKERTSSTLC